jgi:NAD(P) transhydrogenase subunit alpha
MNPTSPADQAADLAARAHALSVQLQAMASHALPAVEPVAAAVQPFVFLLAIFLMACFVGYYVVWNVTPALHSPLMAVTNAISSVIVVGAMLATGLATRGWAMGFGFIAVLLASVNIFGGFMVTQRMLSMFRAKGAAARPAAK